MKIVILSLLATLSVSTLAGKQSARVWKSFFPHAKCGKANSCAKAVPSHALKVALRKAKYFAPKTLRRKWMYVADFTQNSRNKRGYLINIKTGSVSRMQVAHGKGSADYKGNTVRVSNTPNSKTSSKGFYLTQESYYGSHGLSMRMRGMESTNSNARKRAIVVHGAKYVRGSGITGRSWGCPAVQMSKIVPLVKKLRNGSAYYIHR